MNRDNDRQTSIILAVLGILPIVWLGLLIAPSVKGGLPEILPSLMNVMSDPFHIVLCEDSVKTVLVLLLCYRAKITDRTIEQKGCPQCEAEFQQALPQMLIMMYGAQNGITVKSNSDSELGMRLVAYLPELHCAVDIAGATVTEKREQSVKAHICQSNRLGYYLIKRTADASQMAAEIKTLFIRNHIYLHTDSEKDVQVLRERFLEWKYRNACKLNGKY